MRSPHLYPTPFRQHWHPGLARVYPGLLPEVMDGLTHRELRLVTADLERLEAEMNNGA